MKETKFIEQNKEKWERLEKALDNPSNKADELSDLFIQVTDDLSYSRTFYPNRSIRVYLNWLAQRLFFKIYRAKKLKKSSFRNFWTDELPQIMYESRYDVLLAFVVFILSFVVGAFSQSMDPEFATTILGPDYVSETIHNIEKGDPLAIYKSSGPFGMALAIISNNLFVAMLTFLFGFFASIGSIGLLISNGVMVGVFQYFFYERGLLGESFLTIWTHGAIEISSIVLAGAAGIALGKGLLFPGTYHRLKAFQITAQRGLKIFIGIIPFIIVAGIIESYITRLTNTSDVIRLLFILVSFGIMIGYFVIYPIIRHRRGAPSTDYMPYLMPDDEAPLVFNQIKSTGRIFAEILYTFRKYFRTILQFSALLALAFTAFVFLTSGQAVDQVFTFRSSFGSGFATMLEFFDSQTIYPVLNAFFFGGIAWKARQIINKEQNQKTKPYDGIIRWLFVIIPAYGFQATFSLLETNASLFIFLPLVLPIIMGIIAAILYTQSNPLVALGEGIGSVFKRFPSEIGLTTILLIIGFMVISLSSSSILYFLVYLVGLNFQSGSEWLNWIIPILFTFLLEFLLLSTFFGFVFASILSKFSTDEIVNASSLKEEIDGLGTENRIKGMLRE